MASCNCPDCQSIYDCPGARPLDNNGDPVDVDALQKQIAELTEQADIDRPLLDALDKQFMLNVAGYGYDLTTIVNEIKRWRRRHEPEERERWKNRERDMREKR